MIMVPDSAGEDGDATGGGVSDGGVNLVDRQRGLPQLGEPDDVHPATLHRGASHSGIHSAQANSVLHPKAGSPDYVPRLGLVAYPASSTQDSRRRLRTWRTIAAVPMTATVAPAAVIVASFFASRRPATAR